MKTKKIVLAALLIALSFVGANIKIMGSIAFDSMPGFLGALILGPFYGGLIGAIGHFLTALISGFPLSLPVHLITMVGMGITMLVYGLVFKYFLSKNYILAVIFSLIAAVMINGPVLILILSPLLIPVLGKTVLIGMVPVLSAVAALNIIMAQVTYKILPERYKSWK
jgi:uncharacterized membrane protein